MSELQILESGVSPIELARRSGYSVNTIYRRIASRNVAKLVLPCGHCLVPSESVAKILETPKT